MKIKQALRKMLIPSFFRNRHINSLIRNPKIKFICIYANSFCNACCKMCDIGFFSQEGIARALIDTPKHLEISILEKLLNDELLIDRNVYINFAMTEPLLTPHLPSMLKLCKEKSHTVKLTTNGFLLDEKAEEISNFTDIVQISLDGPEDIHNSIRGSNFFSSAINGMKKLRSLSEKVDIGINYTVSNLNYFCLFDFLKFIDQLNVRIDSVKYQFLDFVSEEMKKHHNELYPDIPQTCSSLNDEVNINEIDFENLQKQIDLVKIFKPRKIGSVLFKPPLYNHSALKKYFNTAGRILKDLDKCYGPWMAMAMNTAGKVFWHVRCFNDYILGDIQQNGLKQIFYGEKAEYFRRQLKKSNFCFPACSRCCGVMMTEDPVNVWNTVYK